MAEKKPSFIEKNLPSLARNKGGKTGSGKKKKSIGETTKRGKELRKKEEQKEAEKKQLVEDPSEVKGYKPTVTKLPYANLLPIDSQISIRNRGVRIGFVFMALGIVGLTILVYFVTIASKQYSESFLQKAKEQVVEQDARIAKYEPMKQYTALINNRLKLSSTISQALPEYNKILGSVVQAGNTAGVTYNAVNISSKAAEANAAGAPAAPAAGASGAASGACGPTNNPFNPNTKPVIGCLKITGFASNGTQLDQLSSSLSSSDVLVDVYIATSDPNASKGGASAAPTAAPGGAISYTGTATIVSSTGGAP